MRTYRLIYFKEKRYSFKLRFFQHLIADNYNLLAEDLTSASFRRIKRSYSHERYIEVMVVADAKMATYHGDNLRQYVLTLMATVRHYSIQFNSIE